MHECWRPKGGLTRITEVCEPRSAFSQGHRVLRGQLHPKVVRVLSVDQWLALESLSRLKKQRRTAPRESEWLKAEHAAQLQGPVAELVKCHRHKPIRRLKFRNAAWTALCVYANDGIVVKHQEPVARLIV